MKAMTGAVMPSKLEARINQHDREIAAIRKLLLQGAKMLVGIEAAQRRSDKRMDRLEAAQRRTGKILDRFIRSLERGGSNGHNKTDIR
jgi:septal ring factor EnvC (AmiA/AmiB activator)